MKIACFSDVHGNKLALESVMEKIEKFNPDKIFCLGDIVMAGYDPNYTAKKMIELKEKMKDNFIIIQGNTDKMVAYCNDEMIKNAKENFPCMGYCLEDDVKIIKKEYIDFIKNLKEKEHITINGVKIELVHGSPRRQDENIYPDMDINEVEKIVENSEADLILCGHTHICAGYSLKSEKTVINVGSTGRSMDRDKTPVYLELTIDKNGTILAEHKKVKYDNNQVIKHILSRGLSHGEDLAKMFIV